MRKALVVGASVLGFLAIGWFGLKQLGEEPVAPETSVVVDQIALSPAEDTRTVAEQTTEQTTGATTSAATAEATASQDQTDQGGETEAVEADTRSDASEKSFAEQTAADVVAALIKPEATDPLEKPEPSVQTEAEVTPEAQPETETDEDVDAREDTAEHNDTSETVAEETTLPRFDLVRVDADGQTIIAGKATPGELVEILLDGEVIATANADAAGAFVSVLNTPLSGEAQQLQLRTVREVAPDAVKSENATVAAAPVEQDGQSAQAEPPQSDVETSEVQETGGQKSDTAEAELEQAEAEIAATSDAAAETGSTVATQPEPVEEADSAEAPADTQPTREDTRAALLTVPQLTAPAAQVVPTTETDAAVPVQDAEEPLVTRTGPAAADATQGLPELSEAEPTYALSAPVIILPSSKTDVAPALVQPTEDSVALLQPQGSASSVTLDAINYGETGAVQLNGRGAPGHSVRIYGNGDRLGDTGIEDNGTWAWALARERALGIRLFRFDELDVAGAVASRIETPFTYEALSPKVVRQREVVIQRGDYLWRIAEQYYGEGIRYSLIYGANTDLIRDPDLIYPGQVFSVPELVDAE